MRGVVCVQTAVMLLLSVTSSDVSDASSGRVAARVAGPLSWLEGEQHCRDNGLSLPALPALPAAPHVTSRTPEWTGGLVVTKTYYDGNQTIQIAPRHATNTAVQCCVSKNSSICKEVDGESVLNFTASYRACQHRNMSLSTIVGDNVHMNFRFGNSRGFWFWAKDVNVTSFFKDENITVMCLVNDGSGTMKSDNCDKKHWVVCVDDYLKPVFYLPKLNESAYTPLDYFSSLNPGTSAHPSDYNPLPADGKGWPAWSLPRDVVYLLAGAGGAIMLVVSIVAVCCCCCRRQRVRAGVSGVVCEGEAGSGDSCSGKDAVYAVPDDGGQPTKAKPRTSVTEHEYDVLGLTDTLDRPNTGNVYSHIPMGTNKKKVTKTTHIDSDNDTYDVMVFNTTLSKGVGHDLYEQIDKSPT